MKAGNTQYRQARQMSLSFGCLCPRPKPIATQASVMPLVHSCHPILLHLTSAGCLGSKQRSLMSKAHPEGTNAPHSWEPDKWRAHVGFCSVGLGLASVHRVTLAILAVTFQQELGFTLPQLGVLQSAMLWGYVLGQIPSGFLADKVGGSPLMVYSLVAWCSTSLAMPFVSLVPHAYAFYYILSVRVLLGFFQSGIITSTAAMCARWVPKEDRSKAMGFNYFLYSGGTVLGLWATPMIAKPLGWPAAYIIYAILGFAWAAYGHLSLAPEEEALNFHVQNRGPRSGTDGDLHSKRKGMSREMKIQIAVLVWTHSAIGWGFTFLQNWIPTVLASMGMDDLNSIGFISCLPWVAASVVSLAGGVTADWLYKEKHWSLVEVRRFSQNLACLGPALALFILGAVPNVPVECAVLLLIAAAGLQAFSYAGFHSYAQDVASQDVGKLLGYTNTGGTALGVVCNLATGSLAAGKWGFSSVFYVCAAIYMTSFVTWNLFMKGKKVYLS